MKTLLIFVLFLAAAVADDRCAWGESYYCSSLSAAKSCGAYRHCLTTVWPNNILKEDGSDICLYCTNIINDVKNYISNKQTQQQIQQFLDAACSVIPIQSMAKECQANVNNYLPEILDLITSNIDANVICSLLRLCKGLEDKVYHPTTKHTVARIQVPPKSDPVLCTDCTKFLTDMKKELSSPGSEKKIEQMLETNLCSMLGSLQSECKALVDAYVPEVMELLTGEVDPAQICQALGFCNTTSNSIKLLLVRAKLRKTPLYVAASKMGDSTYCELCKTAVAEVQTLVKEKSTQEEIEQFFKNDICSHLGALKGACDESVDNYAPEFFMILTLSLDPNTLCKDIGLCSGESQISNSIPSLPIILRGEPIAPVMPQVSTTSTTCVLCEFVVNKLDQMLADNATEAEITAALDKVCSFLPSTISTECKDFVDTYGPGILTLLEQELDPKVICTTLGLCRQAKKVMAVHASPEECGVCETLIQYIDSLITQQSTVDEIDKLLEKVCNFLPETMKSQCDTVIMTYGPVIVKLVAQYMDPRELCTEIGLCSNTTKTSVDMEKIVPVKANLVGTNECTYGPSFWCASKENAKKCRAEAHCIKHVWQN